MSLRLFLAFTLPALLSAQNLITTIAGTDPAILPGASALSTPLTPGAWGKPAVDSAGNIYFSVSPLNVVLRVTPAGKIEKFAGNGFPRFSGDGGQAGLASLNAPRDIAVDSRGVVYIADTGNKRVRRVLPTRVIDTVAGGGSVTPSSNGTPVADAAILPGGGLAVDGNDNLYVTIDPNSIGRVDYGGSQIRLYAGTPGRPGTPASGGVAGVQFRAISSLSADKTGNLYLADAGSIAIVRISPVGRVEVLTTRSATFGVPVDVAADPSGIVYFTQSASATIWRYQANTAVAVFAGDVEREGYTPNGTPRERALFGNELRIALDPQNNLVVGDNRNGRLRRVSTVVDTIAGSDLLFSGEGGPATAAVLNNPSYVAQSRGGTYYFSDAASRLVFSIDPRGVLRRVAGTGVLNAPFSDGRAALEGAFGTPYGVAVDSAGNVYVADDDCAIRRIGTDGAMRLFAGLPGLCANPPDGSTAKDARFGRLRGLTFDGAGNLFATDISYHKVWRIGADGIVRTFAGTGLPGTSTTSLPAFQTPLNLPLSVAIAADNTVYIADSGNNRILRIGSDNRSTNYAGVGQRASTGDGGPAAGAAVNQPAGLALDRDGNLYLSELNGHRIRRINANGIISTFAGLGVSGFRGDGGLAVNAALNAPAGLLLNNDGALVIADRDNARLRLVLGSTPVVRIPTTAITLSLTPGTYTQRGAVDLPSPLAGLAFDATVRYSGSASAWLTLTPPRGTLPATLVYEVNSAGLAPGDYSAQIVITTTSATPRETSIPFTLRVPQRPSTPPLTVGDSRLTLSALRGSSTAVSVPVFNPTGSPLTVRGAVTRGDFLAVEPASITVAPGQTASFTLTATANLAPGTYFGAAAFTTGAQSSNISVAFTVSGIRSRLQLSQTGLSFRAVAGAAAPPPQVLYGSLPRLGARAVTISGAPWIAASAEDNRVSVAVDPRGLSAGDYYGRLEVFDAANPDVRQFVTVLMQVLPAGSDPGPEVVPSALLYTAPAGGDVAGQDVQVYLPGNRRAAFTVTGATFEGQPWLRFGPAAGAVSGDAPASFTVQPDLTGLAAGVYRGNVTVTLDGGQTRTVAILAVITPSATRSGKDPERAASSCSSPNLFPQVLAPAPNFVATVGEPVRLAARALDGCGNLHQPESGGTAGVAVTGFGTQVVNLTHIGGGVWEGTVTPNAAQSAITLTYLALFSRGTSLQVGADKVNGAITTAPRPVVFSNALADAASFQFGSPVGPGTLVSLFGDNLSASSALPSALPLPNRLGDVEVRLNDQPIPLLFAGPGQVNAQIPYTVAGDAEYQLEIRRGSALTTPQPVVIAQARPGIFTVDLSGQGQGHIYRALTNGSQVLADAANPVGAGDVLVIYCNGLGATSPGVTAGAAAPFSPLAVTANPVTLTIGGQPASIAFAGLAPGFAGLYQVNAVVPAGVAPGSAVPVVLTVASQASVPVTIGVR